MKIGILSDTHGVLRPDFISVLSTCDYIIHAGDFDNEKTYKQLKDLNVPMYMVRGNCDYGSWCNNFPEHLTFTIGELTFYLIHNHSHMPPVAELTDRPDIVIFGHTHSYTNFTHHNVTYINPGSAGNSRGEPLSILVMDVEGHDFSIRRIN